MRQREQLSVEAFLLGVLLSLPGTAQTSSPRVRPGIWPSPDAASASNQLLPADSSVFQEIDLQRKYGFAVARKATVSLRITDKSGVTPGDLRGSEFKLTVNGVPRMAHLHSPGSTDTAVPPLVLLVFPPNQPQIHSIGLSQAKKYFGAQSSELLPWRVGIFDSNGKLTPFTNGRSQLLANLDTVGHTREPFQFRNDSLLSPHAAWSGSWSDKVNEAIGVMQTYEGPKVILAMNPMAQTFYNTGHLADDGPASVEYAARHIGAHVYIANVGGPDTFIPGGDADNHSDAFDSIDQNQPAFGSMGYDPYLEIDPQTAALNSFAYRTSQMMQTATNTLGGFSNSFKDLAAKIDHDLVGNYSLDFDLTPEDQDRGSPSVAVLVSRPALKVKILDVVPIGSLPAPDGEMTPQQLAMLTQKVAAKPVPSTDFRIFQHVDYFPLHDGLTPELPMSASIEWIGQDHPPSLLSFVESISNENLSTNLIQRSVRAQWNRRSFSWERDGLFRPGHYLWRVIVHDDSGKILASAQQSIAVDYPRPAALRESSLVLGESCREQNPPPVGLQKRPPPGTEQRQRTKLQIDPMRAVDCRVNPESTGRFASTDQLHAFVRIYPEEKFAHHKPESWTARFSLRAQAGNIEEEQEMPFVIDSGSGYVASIELPLDGPRIDSGPHTLDVVMHGPGIRGDLKQVRSILIQAQAPKAPEHGKFTFRNKTVHFDRYDAGDHTPIVILLHGASGPDMPFYREQAQFFEEHGFTVLLLHYLEASESSTATDDSYDAWVGAVAELIGICESSPDSKGRRIALLGYSQGAEVTLAAGSQLVPVGAIAEWYGGLPDKYFYNFKGMPPLLILHGENDRNIPVINATQLVQLCAMKKLVCENHIYPSEGHGFSLPTISDADQRTIEFFEKTLR
jgi:dienelactone hydrolase